MLFTVLTLTAAKHDFGNDAVNTIIALTIAVTKALLVVLFFMHVWYSTRLTKIVVIAGFFWLALLIVLTLSDYFTRSGTSGVGGVPASRSTR